MPKKKLKNGGGDCYEAAAKFIMDECLFSDDCHYLLVHAEVGGRGPLEGTNFGHAYVVNTLTNEAIDVSNGRNIKMSRDFYEALGSIRQIDNFYEYTWAEAREMLSKVGTYGPWELKTSTGF
jgi:hypothetical protein